MNIYDRADSKFQNIVIEETSAQEHECDLSDGIPVMVWTGEYDYNVFYCDADLKKEPVLRK